MRAPAPTGSEAKTGWQLDRGPFERSLGIKFANLMNSLISVSNVVTMSQ